MLTLQKIKTKYLLAISMIFVMLVSAVGTVSAAEFPKGETIPAGETIDDDVFVSGNNVVVDGVVNGILAAAGQTITLNGTINGDAILLGEKVVITDSAVIDGNLFVGAADITIDGQVTGSVFGGSTALDLDSSAVVGRNLFYGGFSLTTGAGSSIGNDLYSGNYQSLLSGSIGRDLKVTAGAIELKGTVGRNAILKVDGAQTSGESVEWMQYNPYISQYVEKVVQPGVRVSETASIKGKVTFISSSDQTSALEKVTAGNVIYQTPVPNEGDTSINYSADQVRPFRRTFPNFVLRTGVMKAAQNFIKLMAIGALVLWLARKYFMEIVVAAANDPLKAIGWGFIIIAGGFLAAMVVPLAFVIAGVIIGFISLGSLLYVWFGLVGLTLVFTFLMFLFAVFTLSKVVAAYMFGEWIMKKISKEENEKIWLNLLVGVFLYIIIRAIPVIGWIAGLAATLIGTGAFWLAAAAKK